MWMEQITEEEIDGLQIFDAVDLCKKLNLDSAGCTNLGEIRDLLKKKIKRRLEADKVHNTRHQKNGTAISQEKTSLRSTSPSKISKTDSAPQTPLLFESCLHMSSTYMTQSQEASQMTSLASNLPQGPNDSLMHGCDEVNESMERKLEKQTAAMKKDLLEMYEKSSCLFASEDMMDGLKEIIDVINFELPEKIALKLKTLQSEECPIVVTGETSTGKSTIINLLIGEELLPCSHLHKTNALCSLRHSEEKYVVYKDVKQTREQHFEKNVLTKVVKDKIDEVFADGKIKDIDIYWPIPLLKNKVNVTIVDTPGLGGDEEMVEILMKYLPNAVAFVYVINSANAGGIEKNKILRILEKQMNLESEGTAVFDIASTIFVCNKWDQVPAEEDRQVMEYIQNKLKDCMKSAKESFNVDKQVFRFIGSHAVSVMRRGGSYTEDFVTLLRAIKVLVSTCLERKYVQSFRWLRQSVLEKTYQTACAHLNYTMTSVEERKKLQEDVEKLLTELEKKCGKALKIMMNEGDTFCKKTVKKLFEHLYSEEVKQRLYTWDESILPSLDSEKLEDTIKNAIIEKIQAEIILWQTNPNFQSNLKTFRQTCSAMYERLKKDIDYVRLQVDSAGQMNDLPETRQHEENDALFGNMGFVGKVASFFAAPFWLPISLIVGMFALPSYGMGNLIKHVAKDVKGALDDWAVKRSYEKNKSGFLKKYTKDFMKSHITSERIEKYIIKPFYDDNFMAVKNWYEQYIPHLIAQNRRFVRSIVREGETSDEMRNKYIPVKHMVRRILTEMTLFRLNYLVKPCIRWSNVQHKRDLYHGYNRLVEEVQYCLADQSTSGVTLVSFLLNDCTKLQEIECMLKLDNNNIVRIIGVMQKSTIDTARIGILVELCQENAESLFHRIIGNKNSAFSDLNKPEVKKAFRLFLDVSIGTCSALEYVHENGYLHGNLKLTKILISQGCEPKLTGMNSIRHEEVSTHKSMSGLSHFAPEVLTGKPYRWASDVYSFGIALWEMWFGRRAFPEEELGNQSRLDFAGKLSTGHHPDIKGEHIPPDKLWKTMQACLECDIHKRPSVTSVLKDLQKYQNCS